MPLPTNGLYYKVFFLKSSSGVYTPRWCTSNLNETIRSVWQNDTTQNKRVFRRHAVELGSQLLPNRNWILHDIRENKKKKKRAIKTKNKLVQIKKTWLPTAVWGVLGCWRHCTFAQDIHHGDIALDVFSFVQDIHLDIVHCMGKHVIKILFICPRYSSRYCSFVRDIHHDIVHLLKRF